MYRVYRTETFDKRVKKLSRKEQNQITRIENQLKINPFVGKPLGYRFFREKKIGGKRIYYLIYEEMVIILLVGLSDKKTQQATINKIKDKLPEYYEAIKVVLQKR
jgi:putative component of toxin-antitoxin plasmid stabilization module